MRVLISGASGLLGRALCAAAPAAWQMVPLKRGQGEGPVWDPATGRIDLGTDSAFDAVIHLAGENIAGGRWTAARKERIRASRVDGTRLLARALAGLDTPPKVLACASAVGVYGDRGDEELDESAAPGSGFLSEVGTAWEEAAEPAGTAGIRVAHMRLGMVLAREGGALARMLTPFRLGVGGRLGSGRQYMSWVCIQDAVNAFVHVIRDASLAGPFNLVAPEPVRNAAFTRALGLALGRPTLLPVPAWGLRLAVGQMAGPLLLASTRAVPRRLQEAGFGFAQPQLEGALEAVLG